MARPCCSKSYKLMHMNGTQLVLIFINLHQIVNFHLGLHNKMGHISKRVSCSHNIGFSHDSSPTNSQSTFMGYNLQDSLAKGPVIPSIPNPEKHIPTSIVNERAFVGYHLNSIQGSLQKGPTPRSMGDPRTYIP